MRQYEDELADNPAVDQLLELAGQHGKVTLLYAAKDPEVNHARVLLEFLAARAEIAERVSKGFAEVNIGLVHPAIAARVVP